ncbi:MAG: GNAT family N-acetyltransferase [Gemmatimonadaceae bacterium]|nr:GNAT family N-acetyltransferase [Gemmatimonadaceae bacterium]MCW5826256.1 GNAT family N-acetyltransferase [Gemmatimonadaceae bacterium]
MSRDARREDTAPLTVDVVESPALSPRGLAELHALCNLAYDETLEQYFVDIGPGLHWIGRVAGRAVAHTMLVTRWLQQGSGAPMRTAFVELVATHPAHQGRGYASALMRAMRPQIEPFEIGALTPTVPEFYARLGWEHWHGPLGVRVGDGIEPSPGEILMFLRTPHTPSWVDPQAPLSIEWRPGEVW